MDLSAAALLHAARDTLAAPRDAARRVIALDLPLQVASTALLLMSVMSAILAHVGFALLPAGVRADFEQVMANPLGTAIVQVIVGVAGALAMHRIGRWRGGTGTMPQAVSLLAWLQFIMLLLQVAQIVAEVVLPPLATILGYAGVGLFLWLLTHFTMELHGFQSAGRTFLGILGAMLVVGFAVALLIAPFMPGPGG